jgi:DNA-binding FrmR family transcriptional regulator
MTPAHCDHCKLKHREDEEKKNLLNRLKRIEGQVRGVQGMVEGDAYCPDILVQVQAIRAALSAFNRELLANHINTCVAEGIRTGDTQVIGELTQVLHKLLK